MSLNSKKCHLPVPLGTNAYGIPMANPTTVFGPGMFTGASLYLPGQKDIVTYTLCMGNKVWVECVEIFGTEKEARSFLSKLVTPEMLNRQGEDEENDNPTD